MIAATRSDASSPMALTADLVELCVRNETDPGPEPDETRFNDGDFEDLADRLLCEHGPDPFWIYAYGSLLWKPAGITVESRLATAPGWHRSFCLEITRWRGSPAQPGLMMGLRRGGQCAGLAQRLPDDDRHAQLVRLLRREIDGPGDLVGLRWIELETDEGPVRALVFWAEPAGIDFLVDLPMPEVARILARACGHIGSGAEYLHRTVCGLELLGIRDYSLWRLQEMVAHEVRGMAREPWQRTA